MVACGAFGALTVGNVKWVWWFFGMCWFLHIVFALGKSWAEAAKSRGGESGAVYTKLAGITVIVWFCYPIVWVFAEGFGNFSVTFEVSHTPAVDDPSSTSIGTLAYAEPKASGVLAQLVGLRVCRRDVVHLVCQGEHPRLNVELAG